jgi:uncharacterized membrane-anchored protein
MPRCRLAFAVTAVACLLAETAAGRDINWTKIREVSRKGPVSVELREQVVVRVPTGYRIVTEDKLSVFHELMGDTPLPEEAGVIIPEEGGWVAVIVFPKNDPLKDQDPTQLNTDALLAWNEEELELAIAKRMTAGLPALRITGWTHKPTYHPDDKRLTMGLRVTPTDDRSSGKKDEVHYKTLIYGPAGEFVCLQTVAAFGNWDKPVEESKKLAEEFTFRGTGEGYATEDPMYYAKIGGAGLVGIIAVVLGSRLLGGRRPEPAAASRAARRFGAPR